MDGGPSTGQMKCAHLSKTVDQKLIHNSNNTVYSSIAFWTF